MGKILVCSLLPLLAGCLTATVPEVAHWMVDYRASDAKRAAAPKYGIGRVLTVTVRVPYGDARIAVFRDDGTLAFDAYNEFAAAPAQLMRGVVFDAMAASGLFSSVVNAHSSVVSSVSVEVQVTRLALDCRAKNGAPQRRAVADVLVRLVDPKGGEIASVPASGSAEAAGKNYGEAFSRAVSDALSAAFGSLR